jgi:hypothetical protein
MPSVIQQAWNVVTNLNNAVLNITNVDNQGNVTGTIQMDQTDTYDITGTWNAATSELNFSYYFTMPVGHFHVTRTATFQGYLFQAGDPLFNSTAGPVSTAVWNMIAGTYQLSAIFGIGTTPTYGWVARSQNKI